MDLSDISYIRLASQQIGRAKFKTARELVAWMGVMQAQDYAMVKWAIGLRLPEATEQSVETEIGEGEIIRTHLLRPTWHFASVNDIRWLLALSAPQINISVKSRHAELGLSEAIFSKSKEIIGKALQDGGQLTREELMSELRNAGISITENRSSHILMRAELDGIICSGETRKGKPTYALLEDRVAKAKPLTRDEALEALAQRYFFSHGPATLQDFTWWSGLSGGDAKHALDLVKPDLISEIIDGQTYWLPAVSLDQSISHEPVYLLPAYDEFIISYHDRSAVLTPGAEIKAISDNGIFRPLIIVNGKVTGIWKRTIKKDNMIVETDFFVRPNGVIKNKVDQAAERFGRFLGKKTETIHHF